VDKVVEAGIGLVNLHQAVDFYNSMHSYMAGAGATGVKVNVIHVSPSNNYQIHFK
jgi:stachyose synthetase